MFAAIVAVFANMLMRRARTNSEHHRSFKQHFDVQVRCRARVPLGQRFLCLPWRLLPAQGRSKRQKAPTNGQGGTCAVNTCIAVGFIATQVQPRPNRDRRHQCAGFAGVSACFGATREWCCVFTQHMMYANMITLLRGLMFANMTVFLGGPFFC